MRAANEYKSTPLREWLSRTELELDNFRAAMSWALSPGNEAPLAGQIAGSLRTLWYIIGLSGEGRKWVEAALPLLGEAHPTIRASLILTEAWTTDGKSCFDACMRARQLFDEVADKHGAALALGLAANAALQLGELSEAEKLNDRALEIFQDIGETGQEFLPRIALRANLCVMRGDFAAARAIYAETLVRYPAASDERFAPVVKAGLANLECIAGNAELAIALGNEALGIDRVNGRRVNVIIDMVNLAIYYLMAGKTTEARDVALQAMRLGREIQHSYLVTVAIGHVADAAALNGAYEPAAQLVGYVDNWYGQAGQKREFPESDTYKQFMQLLHEHVERDSLAAWMSAGVKMAEDQAVEEAAKT